MKLTETAKSVLKRIFTLHKNNGDIISREWAKPFGFNKTEIYRWHTRLVNAGVLLKQSIGVYKVNGKMPKFAKIIRDLCK